MALGYDFFAPFYDLSLERLYRPIRREVVEHLQVEPQHRVLVVACGTGQDFPHLLEKLGPDGSILGVDFSAAMLARAAAKHDDPRIELLEADAASLQPEQTGPVDRVLITLGLTVIPQWKETVEACFRVLKPGGRIAVFDVFAERWVPQTTMVEFMAGADIRGRKVWEPVLERGEHGELTWLEGSPHIHGGRMFVATATRA